MNEKDNHVIQTFLIQTWNMVGRKVVEEFVTSIHPEEWRMNILYIEKQENSPWNMRRAWLYNLLDIARIS